MQSVLNVVLSHQAPSEVDELAGYWRSLIGDNSLLIAYGGPPEFFDEIQFNSKLFIADSSLRTLDHQREGQSYTSVFKEVSDRLRTGFKDVAFVTLFEFDHLPLVPDVNVRQIELMQDEQADVIAYHLARIDGTSHPHYLHYAAKIEFTRFFEKLSVRADRRVVLSMLGTGSCWKREAFEAVAGLSEPFPIYFEVYLPTLAHHLGFRLRDCAGQDMFVSNLGDRSAEIISARSRGAWSLHPVKQLPEPLSPFKKT